MRLNSAPLAIGDEKIMVWAKRLDEIGAKFAAPT
jgi:hypothetical protein